MLPWVAMNEVADNQGLANDKGCGTKPLGSEMKKVRVEPFTSEGFTPVIRELMLAQPLNGIKSVGFRVLSSRKGMK